VDAMLDGSKAETRMADGNLQVIVQFNRSVTTCNLSVTGTANIVSQSLSGNELTVRLSQVANRQSLRLNLGGVVGQGSATEQSFSLPVRVLLGDLDQSGLVDARDVNRMVNAINSAMRDTNVTDWSPDLNSDGKINTGDLMVILRNRGQRLN
jgi:hypothetical protein